jgi:alpha-glucosidase
MTDFDGLLSDVHARGLRVIVDFVPNHSSDQHPWFKESRSSRNNLTRDWYIWRDPAPGGGSPNNWLSEFGGSAWQFDETTGQYYYHAFLKQQPDLNWRNPQLVAAMHDVMRFWLKRGVDGFRVDVIWHLIKDDQFRDDPPNPDWRPGDPEHRRFVHFHSADRAEVHDVIRGMRKVIDEFPDGLLIGEIYLPVERLVAYYGRDLTGAHLPFNFALIENPWQARILMSLIGRYEAVLPRGAWPNWVLGNHDKTRLATRIGEAQARVAAMLLLTLRGTPTLYYGDEIGLPQVDIPAGQVQDPYEKNVPGRGFGRDGCRTPMQWDVSRFAGFSTAEPWLPVTADFARRNVEAQRRDPASLYNLYRNLIALRRIHPALASGSYRPVAAEGDVLAYAREQDEERFLVALNLGSNQALLALGDGQGTIVLSAFGNRVGENVHGQLKLGGNDGLLIKLD